jgi:hypothetical protein
MVLVPVLSVACGGDGPTEPTPVTRSFETFFEGSIPGRSSVCNEFRPDAAGPVYANVGLRTPIELGTGGCAGSRSVVARSETGEVMTTLPAGLSFVRFEHTGDGQLGYRVVLRYLLSY